MEGTCICCGQIEVVNADNKEDADRIATENCTCENSTRDLLRFKRNIEIMTGKEAEEIGFVHLQEHEKHIINELAEMIVNGSFTGSRITLQDSELIIKRKNNGKFIVERKKQEMHKLES